MGWYCKWYHFSICRDAIIRNELTRLDMAFNNLTTLPESIVNLKKLRLLILLRNLSFRKIQNWEYGNHRKKFTQHGTLEYAFVQGLT